VVGGAWLFLARAAFAGRSEPRTIAPRQPLFRRSPD
jgi:hypothetical protein